LELGTNSLFESVETGCTAVRVDVGCEVVDAGPGAGLEARRASRALRASALFLVMGGVCVICDM